MSSSLSSALIVSSVLTLAIVVPMGIDASSTTDDLETTQNVVTLGDVRFPLPVGLASDQFATGTVDDTDGIDQAEVAAATVVRTATPEPTSTSATSASPDATEPGPGPTTPPRASPTIRQSDEPDEDEQHDPTATPTTTASPIPTQTPVSPTTPPVPTPTTPAPPPLPTTTPIATLTMTPTPIPTVEPATDVYAEVDEAVLIEAQPGMVAVRAVNGGKHATTTVSVIVSASGAQILNVEPTLPDWTCTAAGVDWVCVGESLKDGSVSGANILVIPTGTIVTISIDVNHAIADPNPENNSATRSLVVEPAPDPAGVAAGATPTA